MPISRVPDAREATGYAHLGLVSVSAAAASVRPAEPGSVRVRGRCPAVAVTDVELCLLLFARIRNIERVVQTLQGAAGTTTQIDYDLLASKVAEKLSAPPAE